MIALIFFVVFVFVPCSVPFDGGDGGVVGEGLLLEVYFCTVLGSRFILVLASWAWLGLFFLFCFIWRFRFRLLVLCPPP